MKATILMTAMPPTVGHGYLITWAANYCRAKGIRELNVVVGTQPSEPMCTERFTAIKQFCRTVPFVGYMVTHHFHKECQQQPHGPDDTQFWKDWRDNLNAITTMGPDDILISSEDYGAKVAAALGCSSIVCDPYREIVRTKATRIRQNPLSRINEILPEFLPYVRKTVTIFGAESTGKTTLAKSLSPDGLFVHEWARPYLETLPSPETTPERMEEIVYGQYAAQMAAKQVKGGHSAIVQDTDLLSTIGYYRILCKDYEALRGYRRCIELFKLTKSDLYLMPLSNIPFEEDPLRYGGRVRQGSDEFWEELLKEFDCKYVRISETSREFRKRVSCDLIDREFWTSPIWGFERVGNK